MGRSTLFLGFLVILLILRAYLFPNYLFLNENVTILQPVQDYLVTLCKQVMPEPQSALLAGMLIGEKQDLPSDFKKSLTNTSTIHIVVVSGQNLSLLAGFVLAFVPWFGRKKTVLVTIGVVIFYSIMTGLQVPVVRAAFMSLFSLIGMLLNREVRPLKILLYTVVLTLMINPAWITSISYQLSFVATVGVMVVAPEVEKLDNFLPDVIKQDFWVSTSAQLLTIPIIAINFHRVSLIGVITNQLVLWTVGPVMIGGIISLIGVVINQVLGQMLGMFPNILLLYFVDVINLSDQKWGSLYVQKLPAVFWVGYYITFAGIYLFVKAKNSRAQSKINDRPRVLTA